MIVEVARHGRPRCVHLRFDCAWIAIVVLPLATYHLHLLCSEPPPNDAGDENNNDATQSGLTDADFDSNWDEAIETFDGMGLPEELLRGIYSYGFEKPSAIQQRAIKPTMLGRDLIAQAQSGTVRRTILWLVGCVVGCWWTPVCDAR